MHLSELFKNIAEEARKRMSSDDTQPEGFLKCDCSNHRGGCAGTLGSCDQINVASSLGLIGADFHDDTLELERIPSVRVKLAIFNKGLTSCHLAISVICVAVTVAHGVVLLRVTR